MQKILTHLSCANFQLNFASADANLTKFFRHPVSSIPFPETPSIGFKTLHLRQLSSGSLFITRKIILF